MGRSLIIKESPAVFGSLLDVFYCHWSPLSVDDQVTMTTSSEEAKQLAGGDDDVIFVDDDLSDDISGGEMANHDVGRYQRHAHRGPPPSRRQLIHARAGTTACSASRTISTIRST